MRIRTTLILLLAMVGFATTQASDTLPQVEKMNMGTYWYGANIDKKELLGKVVVLELWGKN